LDERSELDDEETPDLMEDGLEVLALELELELELELLARWSAASFAAARVGYMPMKFGLLEGDDWLSSLWTMTKASWPWVWDCGAIFL